MPNSADIETFVAAWVARHLRSLPDANLAAEVDRLAAGMTGDARALGISGRDLHRAVGDIDDYLTAQLQARAG